MAYKINKKNVIEALSHIITIAVVVAFFLYRSRIEKRLEVNENVLALKSSIDVENKFTDRAFPSVILKTNNGQNILLPDLLSNSKINVVLFTSLNGCDLCRDNELKRWGQFSVNNNRANVFLIISEDITDPKKVRESFSMVNGLSGLPAYIDSEGLLKRDFGVSDAETPIIFFVSSLGKIEFVYKGHFALQNRSDHFLSLLNYSTQIPCGDQQ